MTWNRRGYLRRSRRSAVVTRARAHWRPPPPEAVGADEWSAAATPVTPRSRSSSSRTTRSATACGWFRYACQQPGRGVRDRRGRQPVATADTVARHRPVPRATRRPALPPGPKHAVRGGQQRPFGRRSRAGPSRCSCSTAMSRSRSALAPATRRRAPARRDVARLRPHGAGPSGGRLLSAHRPGPLCGRTAAWTSVSSGGGGVTKLQARRAPIRSPPCARSASTTTCSCTSAVPRAEACRRHARA